MVWISLDHPGGMYNILPGMVVAMGNKSHASRHHVGFRAGPDYDITVPFTTSEVPDLESPRAGRENHMFQTKRL